MEKEKCLSIVGTFLKTLENHSTSSNNHCMLHLIFCCHFDDEPQYQPPFLLGVEGVQLSVLKFEKGKSEKQYQ